MLGLHFCVRAFSNCSKRGPLFIAVHGPLTIAASIVVEHRLQTHRLSNCGSRAQLLRSMWDLPRPGLKPVSPALAGRFSTTAPPGKPPQMALMVNSTKHFRRQYQSFTNSFKIYIRSNQQNEKVTYGTGENICKPKKLISKIYNTRNSYNSVAKKPQVTQLRNG